MIAYDANETLKKKQIMTKKNDNDTFIGTDIDVLSREDNGLTDFFG